MLYCIPHKICILIHVFPINRLKQAQNINFMQSGNRKIKLFIEIGESVSIIDYNSENSTARVKLNVELYTIKQIFNGIRAQPSNAVIIMAENTCHYIFAKQQHGRSAAQIFFARFF